MSSSTVYNLLRNSDLTRHELSAVAAATTGKAATYMTANWGNASKPTSDSSGLHFTGPTKYGNANSGVGVEFAASDLGLINGDTYVLSVEVASLAAADANNGLAVWQYASENEWWTGKAARSKWSFGAGVYRTGFVYDGSAYVYLLMSVGQSGSATVTRFGLYHAASAAWAPAEGETLTGGGALMSANLLDGLTLNLVNGTVSESDGTWHHAARTETDGHVDYLVWYLPNQAALETNQTYHVGLSVRGASGSAASLHASIGYEDAAGKHNWATSDALAIGTSWDRDEATIIVPSGMKPFAFYVAAYGACPETWMANPTLSLGSPVCLASSAHTPYATQDHVAAEYATKASLKVTDDSIKAEVTQRTKTDQMVSDLSSRLTQTADGFNASIDRLSDTDKKVNSWFGFGSDSSGNPQLKMGSSTSPVVGVYTNAGLAYMSRNDATIMELDASRSATISDHIEAQDMKLGKWKWIQTQDGTHLTLVWAG